MDIHFKNIKDVIRGEISKAEKSIYIAVAWLNDEDLIFSLIRKKRTLNIPIKVLISEDEANFRKLGRLNELVKANISLRIMKNTSKFLHHKLCLIDDKVYITGSYNWTYSASKNNLENIIIININLSNTELLGKIKDEFETYFNSSYSSDYKESLERRNVKSRNDEQLEWDKEELILRDLFRKKLTQYLLEIDIINKKSILGKINTNRIRDNFALHGDSVNYVKHILKEESNGVAKWGFHILKAWKRTDLSFESLALEKPFENMFSIEEKMICRKILGIDEK